MSNTIKTLEAKVAELEAKLAKANTRKVAVKTSEKGVVYLSGVRARHAVAALYPGEWDILFAHADEIRAACEAARPIAEANRSKS